MQPLARLYQVLAALNMLACVGAVARMVSARSGEDLLVPLVLLALNSGMAWHDLRMCRRYRDDDDDDDFGRLIPVEDGA